MDDADELALFEFQGGCCAICRKPLGISYQVHFDHDHFTGEARGLLCSGCNTSIGKLGDTREGVMRAVRYLESPPWQQMNDYEHEEIA